MRRWWIGRGQQHADAYTFSHSQPVAKSDPVAIADAHTVSHPNAVAYTDAQPDTYAYACANRGE